MKNPLLSIIIPVYNGEKYIDNIISAFDKQSSDEFELIFVDDGSKDASYDKINFCINAKKYMVTVIRQKNMGVSAARNAGIKAASGKYITFVDVDDYVTEDYIEYIINGILKYNAELLVFQSARIRENTRYIIDNNPSDCFKSISNLEVLKKFISNPTNFAVYNVVIHSELIEKNNLFFSVGYKYYEDYDFLIRLFCLCEKIEFTERMLYFYIQNEGSAMATFVPERLSCLSLLERLNPFVSEHCPDFSPLYKKWMTARISWSVMWQACRAFSFSDSMKFAKKTYMKKQMQKLYDYPNKKVRISAGIFCALPFVYFFLVRIFGGTHTKVRRTSAEAFDKYFDSLPKKILVYGMTENPGGIESYIMNMYRHIDKSRIMFDFITDWDRMAYSDEILKNGSEIFYIPSKSSHPIRHLLKFFKILKSNKQYKTVYFNILNAGAAYSMAVPFLLRRKIVIHSHNGADENLKLHNFFMKPLNFFADKRLACSEIAGRYMFGNLTYDNGEVTIIKNAIDINSFLFNNELRKVKRAKLNLENEFTVLHVGRMNSQKNPIYLLEIFKELLKFDSKSVLLYAGTGDMADEVREFADKIKISENIRFLGVRNDVSELMQAADAFLLPSKYEGLPVVAIEAQTADLKCFLSENITREVKITDNVNFISVSSPPSLWAEYIYNTGAYTRRNRSKEITEAGYNIENEVVKLTEILIS